MQVPEACTAQQDYGMTRIFRFKKPYFTFNHCFMRPRRSFSGSCL